MYLNYWFARSLIDLRTQEAQRNAELERMLEEARLASGAAFPDSHRKGRAESFRDPMRPSRPDLSEL